MIRNTGLRQKTISAALWAGIDSFGHQAIQFIKGIVLARLLMPADYGLIGMLAIFINLSGIFTESGLTWAIIRKEDSDQKDYSTVFFFNISIGTLIYIILFLSAPFISDFYKDVRLISIVKIYGLTFLIGSLAVVQRALFAKRLDFKARAKASLVASLTSGFGGICLAYFGYGVWALVFQSVTYITIETIVLWAASPWRPTLIFDYTSFKYLFQYSYKISLDQLIGSFMRDSYSAIIGKFFTVSELGFYIKGKGLADLPMRGIHAVIWRIFFPAFSMIQKEPERLLNSFKKVIKISTYTILPIMIGVLIVAKPLIRVLLTDKWIDSVIFLQLFSLIAILYPINSLSLDLINVKGRSDLYFKLGLMGKLSVLLNILITFRWGIIAMVIGHLVMSILITIITLFFMGRLIEYRLIHLIKDLLPYIGIVILMGTLVYFIGSLVSNDLARLLIQVSSGLLIYIVISKIFHIEAFYEILDIIKLQLNRK